MVSANDQTQMYGPDSPRFTKTNPILYYMLQRSNAQLVKEGERLEVGSGQMQTNVKNESSGDTEAFELWNKIHRITMEHLVVTHHG